MIGEDPRPGEAPILPADLRDLVAGMEPGDDVERDHLRDAVAWLTGTDDVFRRQVRPTRPGKHLVSYFLVVDRARRRVLLGDHVKAGLWLPPGGHVEPGEHPVATVRRECREELGFEARFLPGTGERPVLLTVTETVPRLEPSHTDVSLWFLLDHDGGPVHADPAEFHEVRWWTPAEVRATDPARFDPHLPRMLTRLDDLLAGAAS